MKKLRKKTTKELIKAIEEAINKKNYYFTTHALKRSKERKNVGEFQILRILKSKSKYHEAKKDNFNEIFQSWNYAIIGFSDDDEMIRVIVSFDHHDLLIITVINLDNGGEGDS